MGGAWTGTRQREDGTDGGCNLEPGLKDHAQPAPRDPFAVDISAALDALAADWGDGWEIAFANGRWRAQRRDGAGLLLTCETPDELVRAMRGCGGGS